MKQSNKRLVKHNLLRDQMVSFAPTSKWVSHLRIIKGVLMFNMKLMWHNNWLILLYMIQVNLKKKLKINLFQLSISRKHSISNNMFSDSLWCGLDIHFQGQHCRCWNWRV